MCVADLWGQRAGRLMSVVPPPSETETAMPAIPVAASRPVKRRRASSKRDFESMISGKRQSSKPLMCLPRATFHRVVAEIIADLKPDLRIQCEALNTLQEDAELLLVERFKRCSRLAEFCRRDTVRETDWRFVGEDEGSLALPYSGRS